MTTLHALRQQIDATGRFDLSMVMRVALVMARGERDASRERCRRYGWSELPWREQLAAGLRRAWDWAHTFMDARQRANVIGRMSPVERTARRLDLGAELAATAIPPRPDEAARFTALAATCRAVPQFQIAAE